VCCQFLAWVSRNWPQGPDRGAQLEAISTHSPDLGDRFPEIAQRRQTARQILVMDASGIIYGGLRGVGLILQHLRGWALRGSGHLLFNPVMAALGTPFYKLFAANRHRLSRIFGLRSAAISCDENNVCSGKMV